MAGLLSAAQLARFQAVATSALDISGVLVQSATLADDGYGLQTPAWTTVATVAAGEAKPSAAIMQQYASRIGTLKSWVVRLPFGTVCAEGYQLVFPSGDKRLVQADLSDSSYTTAQLYLVSEVKP
jgi:hypothetical protein